MRRGVAYASCGHAFHPICLLEYEKHAGQRTSENAMKCPLCRQPYTVKHFVPDDNLRSLCLEHTLQEAIVLAESAAKDADEKAKEAGQARIQAAHAVQHASHLRQQAGPSFCSPNMASRLSALTQAARAGCIPASMHTASTSMHRVAGAMGRHESGLTPGTSDSRDVQHAITGSMNRNPSSLVAPQRRIHHTPAAVAAAAVAPTATEPGPGFDLGVHVPLHEQIATMRISADAETLHSAAQHPEVVLGIEEPE